MFTGIITHSGRIIKTAGDSLVIFSDFSLTKELEKGMSIATNGVCLTVLEKPIDRTFRVEVMPETFKRSMLGKLKTHDSVNLELPVTTQTLLSGHIVQGHVDGTGIVQQIEPEGNSNLVTIDAPKDLLRYIVEKGFIAINGISLTIISVTHDSFTVGIIPFTWKHTMLPTLQKGDQVNIEVDILAKYVEKLINRGGE